MLSLEGIQLLFKQAILVIICLSPLIPILLWMFSWRLTYRTVGSLERIIVELKKRIKTGENKAIHVRKGDGAEALVEGINHLFKKTEIR